ncbi:MAG: pyridoxal 5'-phosphate synthase glutaminase subunit PdxT [Myxococcota bacterium]
MGIVALQGAVGAHETVLDALGIPHRRIFRSSSLDDVDGVILPGGESTAQTRLMGDDQYRFAEGLQRLADEGRPILATCAGLILAADWGLLNVDVTRNGWGRQVASFEAMADDARTPLVCIRAPRIGEVRVPTTIVLTLQGEPIRVQQGSVVGATDHPELTDDRRLHRRLFAEWRRPTPDSVPSPCPSQLSAMRASATTTPALVTPNPRRGIARSTPR